MMLNLTAVIPLLKLISDLKGINCVLVENGKGTYMGVCSYSLDVLLLEGFTFCHS